MLRGATIGGAAKEGLRAGASELTGLPLFGSGNYKGKYTEWSNHIDDVVNDMVATENRTKIMVLGEGQGLIAKFVNKDPRRVTEFLDYRPRYLNYSDVPETAIPEHVLDETLEFNLFLIYRLHQKGFQFEVKGDFTSSVQATSTWLREELKLLESLNAKWKNILQSEVDRVDQLPKWGRQRRGVFRT